MIIEINKNIDNYKETVLFGLTAKQLIFSTLSVGVGGGIVLLSYPYIGLTTSAYIAIPAVAPIALSGFYSYNGMSFMEMIRLKLHFSFGNKTLLYHSTEGPEEIEQFRVEEQMKVKREKKKKSKNKR